MPLASPLAQQADEAIVASATRIDAAGSAALAAAERRFVARMDGPIDALTPALASRGARIEAHGSHLAVDLGASMTTSELVSLCDAAGVAVVELVPAFRALS